MMLLLEPTFLVRFLNPQFLCLHFEHQKRPTLHSLEGLHALFTTMLSSKKSSSKAFPLKCEANSAAIVVLFSLLHFQETSNKPFFTRSSGAPWAVPTTVLYCFDHDPSWNKNV
jgi:hypothetical protein